MALESDLIIKYRAAIHIILSIAFVHASFYYPKIFCNDIIRYGIQVQSATDPLVQMAEAASNAVSAAAIPGQFLMDFIPQRACIYLRLCPLTNRLFPVK